MAPQKAARELGRPFSMFYFVAVTFCLGLAVYLLRKRTAGKVALLLCTLSLCLTLAEAYYRFFYAQSDGFGILEKNFARRYYQRDRFGLRASNLPLSETKPNLVVIGDSHVFGAGLRDPEDRFSNRLARHYPHLHVVNLGSSGWDTVTETHKLGEYLGENRARVAIVILAYFFNDIEEDVMASDRTRLKLPPPADPTRLDTALQVISRHSRFVELFYYRIGYPRLVHHRLSEIHRFYDDPLIMERHLQTLGRLRSLVEERYSARLLVVALPYLHSQELLEKANSYSRFRAALEARGFRYLDMQPVFAASSVKQLALHRFDPHTNGFANSLIAKQIVGFLDMHSDLLQ